MIPLRVHGSRVLVALAPQDDSVEESIGMHYQDKGRAEGGVIVLARPTDSYDVEQQSRGMVVALGEKRGQIDLDDVAKICGDLAREIHDGYPSGTFQGTYNRLRKQLRGLRSAPFGVQIGDVVLFPPSAGISLGEQDDGIRYVILAENEIWAILEPMMARTDAAPVKDLEGMRYA